MKNLDFLEKSRFFKKNQDVNVKSSFFVKNHDFSSKSKIMIVHENLDFSWVLQWFGSLPSTGEPPTTERAGVEERGRGEA